MRELLIMWDGNQSKIDGGRIRKDLNSLCLDSVNNDIFSIEFY